MHAPGFLRGIFSVLGAPDFWSGTVTCVSDARNFSRMKKVIFLLLLSSRCFFVGLVFAGLAHAQTLSREQPVPQSPPAHAEIMKVEDVRPGMKGVGYTVFQGIKPEPMGVEVLGVLKNMNGPQSDLVLVRLQGEKAEYTGVVAGMSGSPVYIDGKLLGAVAFRIGAFSKEPIAGVTPIEQMLEINEFDHNVPPSGTASSAKPVGAAKTSGPGASDTNALQSYAQYLQPIDAPFVFSG